MKKITAFSLGIFLLLGTLSGCSGGESEVGYIDVDKLAEETPSKITMDTDIITADTSSDSVIAKNNSKDSINSDDESSGVSAEIAPSSSSTDNAVTESNNGAANSETGAVKVDADVIIHSESSYGIFGVSNVGITEPDALKIKNMLWKSIAENGADVKYEVIKSEFGENYIWSTPNLNLVIDGDDSSIYMDGQLSNFITNVFYPPMVNSATNIERFEQGDLAFCTRKEASDTVLNILDELGIDVFDEYEVYSLNQKDLERATGETVKKYPSINHDGTFPTKLSSDYECYYFRFNARYKNTPIYDQMINFQTMPNYFINDPEITAIYSSKGLEYLRISEYPYKIDLAEEVTKLISAEDAARIAAAKYEDVKTSQSISIDKISLMYVYTPPEKIGKNSGNYSVMMTPAWACSGTLKYDFVNGSERTETTLRNDIIINAVTGEEII